MGDIYSVGTDRNLILYSSGNSIIMKNIMGNSGGGRTYYLKKDYSYNLTSTIFNATIYYSYVNTIGDIVVSSISQTTPLYTVSLLDDSFNPMPFITSYNNTLVLVYISFSPLDRTYIIKCSFPLSSRSDINVTAPIKTIPAFKVLSCEKCLYIYACAGNSCGIILIDDKDVTTRLFTADEADAMAAQKYHKTINEKDAIIDSIKSQYSQLMDTANKHRDEAIKWRSKNSH